MAAAAHHTDYEPAVLRAPSPTSSVGTSYGIDQTVISDNEANISQGSFEKKWEERLELHVPRREEEIANQSPLLPRPPSGSHEERIATERILYSLRREISNLEENELFQQTLFRGSQTAMEQPPSTNDIDVLMRGMMVNATVQATQRGSNSGNTHISNGPWNISHSNNTPMLPRPIEEPVRAAAEPLTTAPSGIVVGKRRRNGTSRRL